MATIDELLRNAQLTRSSDAPDRAGLHEEHVAAWQAVARHASRVIRAVPARLAEADKQLLGTLASLERGSVPRSLPGVVDAEAGILSVALRLGAVADLLSSASQEGIPKDDPAAAHLRHRVYGTLYRTAAYTVPAMAPNRAGWQAVLSVAHQTAPWRGVRQEAGGPLEDLAVPATTARDVESLAFRWERAASRALAEQPTSLVYQSVAADLAVATATVGAMGVHLREQLPTYEKETLQLVSHAQAAHQRWSQASRWPDYLTFRGARTPTFNEASQQFRRALDETFRRDGRWLSAEEVFDNNTPTRVLDAVRRISATSARVASDYETAFRGLAEGQDRLWIRSSDIPEPWATATPQAGRWAILDPVTQQAARQMLKPVEAAAKATTALPGHAYEIARQRVVMRPTPTSDVARTEHRHLAVVVTPPHGGMSR